MENENLNEAFRDAMARRLDEEAQRREVVLESKAIGQIGEGYVRCYNLTGCSFDEYLDCINAMVQRQVKAYGDRFAELYGADLDEAGPVSDEDRNKLFFDVAQKTM